MAGTRAKALARCKQPMGTGGHCCQQQSADKGQTGSDLHLFRGHVWRGSVGHDEGGQRDKMSAVVKLSRSILACIPRLLF
jgi:hypothetical protein